MLAIKSVNETYGISSRHHTRFNMTSIPPQALAATWYKHGDDGQIEQKPVRHPKDLAPGEVRSL